MKRLVNILVLMLSVILVKNDASAKDRNKHLSQVNGLKVGTYAPDFTTIDADSQQFSLRQELQKGKVVLLFYRGQWCPVCNRHLKAMEDSLKLITDLGATVIAISPETAEFADQTKKKTNASYRLLYDEDYAISRKYDVAFTPDKISIVKYSAIGAHFKEAHNNEVTMLPVPATYIIDRNGKISWRHFDRDYKRRASVADIVNALKQN